MVARTEIPVKTRDEWERRIKQKLRDRGWPMDDIDHRADETMRRAFKPEWMDRLREYQRASIPSDGFCFRDLTAPLLQGMVGKMNLISDGSHF